MYKSTYCQESPLPETEMDLAETVARSLIQTYPSWPVASLAEAVLRSPRQYTKVVKKDDKVYTKVIFLLEDACNIDSNGTPLPFYMKNVLINYNTKQYFIYANVIKLVTKSDIQDNISSICYNLLLNTNVNNLVLYISRNKFHSSNTRHISEIIQNYGALFIRPHAAWYSLVLIGRIDIVALTCAALRQFLGITTKLQEHIVLAEYLTCETYIDCQFECGKQVLQQFFNICSRACIDALVCKNISRQECEEKGVANSDVTSSGNRAYRKCVYVRNETHYTIILIKDYDLMFVWLCMLFDIETLFWNTELCKWGSCAQTSPVPSLFNILSWKERCKLCND